MPFVLTNKALEDLKDIARYTEKQWGIEQRTKYLTLLDESFHAIEADPCKGTDSSFIREGYRKLKVGSHFVFYREKKVGTVEIVRILHGRMDFISHFVEQYQ